MSHLRSEVVMIGVLLGALAIACAAPTPAAGPATAAVPTQPPAKTAETAAPKAAASPTAAPKVELAASVSLAMPTIQDQTDPHRATFGPQDQMVHVQMFDGLTQRDAEGRLVAALAESWRSVNPTTWEFRLKPNVKFHNGAVLSSQDVKASVERFLDPATRNPIINLANTVGSAEVVDPLTVRIVTRQPDGLLPARVGTIRIVSSKALQDLGENFAQSPVGTGPYKLASFAPGNYLLDAFPDSWRGAPKMSQLRLLRIAEGATAVSAVRTGEIDIAVDLPIDTQSTLRGDPTLNVMSYTRASTQHVNINLLRFPSVQDKRVRHALNYAVDKAAIEGVVSGGAGSVSPGQLVSQGATGYNPSLQAYPFDLARAQALMREAGMADGFSTPMVTSVGALARAAEATAGYLNRINVRTEVQALEFGTFLDRFNQGTMPALWYSAIDFAALFDADQPLTFFMGTQSDALRRMQNAEFDRLMTASKTEVDGARREQLLREASAILREEAPVIFMFQPGVLVAANKKVDGIAKRVDTVIRFDTVTRAR